MTMEELLKSLQKKCRVECEEAHRQLVCALNGLAGIHIIRGINPHFSFPMGISSKETQDLSVVFSNSIWSSVLFCCVCMYNVEVSLASLSELSATLSFVTCRWVCGGRRDVQRSAAFIRGAQRQTENRFSSGKQLQSAHGLSIRLRFTYQRFQFIYLTRDFSQSDWWNWRESMCLTLSWIIDFTFQHFNMQIIFLHHICVLQRLHATHNLMELLSAKHSGIPPTLRDDRLSEEVIYQHFHTQILDFQCYRRVKVCICCFSFIC